MLPAIVSIISAPEVEVKKQAVWICANCATNGSSEQIRSLVEAGTLEALCGALVANTNRTVLTVALEAILTVVVGGTELVTMRIHTTNIYVDRIRNFQGETIIEGFLSHSDADIQSLAQSILDALFEENMLVSSQEEAFW